MNGLDLFRSPKTAADEIADIVSAQCPPVVPENCDAFSCRECWLAWLTTGDRQKKRGRPTSRQPRAETPLHTTRPQKQSEKQQKDLRTETWSTRL